MPCGELKKKGDLGVGTFDGLDAGETLLSAGGGRQKPVGVGSEKCKGNRGGFLLPAICPGPERTRLSPALC